MEDKMNAAVEQAKYLTANIVDVQSKRESLGTVIEAALERLSFNASERKAGMDAVFGTVTLQ